MDLKKSLVLYAITNHSALTEEKLLVDAAAVLRGGVTAIQLRDKGLERGVVLHRARSLLRLTRQYGVPLIINDDPVLALETGAGGVHLGPDDTAVAAARAMLGGGVIIGATARTVEQALRAEKDGADYLGSGAVFPTSTKTDAVPMSAETLRAIVNAVKIPVIAVGGVNAGNIPKLAGLGLAGVAVSGGLFGCPEPGQAAAALKAIKIFGGQDEI